MFKILQHKLALIIAVVLLSLAMPVAAESIISSGNVRTLSVGDVSTVTSPMASDIVKRTIDNKFPQKLSAETLQNVNSQLTQQLMNSSNPQQSINDIVRSINVNIQNSQTRLDSLINEMDSNDSQESMEEIARRANVSIENNRAKLDSFVNELNSLTNPFGQATFSVTLPTTTTTVTSAFTPNRTTDSAKTAYQQYLTTLENNNQIVDGYCYQNSAFFACSRKALSGQAYLYSEDDQYSTFGLHLEMPGGSWTGTIEEFGKTLLADDSPVTTTNDAFYEQMSGNIVPGFGGQEQSAYFELYPNESYRFKVLDQHTAGDPTPNDNPYTLIIRENSNYQIIPDAIADNSNNIHTFNYTPSSSVSNSASSSNSTSAIASSVNNNTSAWSTNPARIFPYLEAFTSFDYTERRYETRNEVYDEWTDELSKSLDIIYDRKRRLNDIETQIRRKQAQRSRQVNTRYLSERLGSQQARDASGCGDTSIAGGRGVVSLNTAGNRPGGVINSASRTGGISVGGSGGSGRSRALAGSGSPNGGGSRGSGCAGSTSRSSGSVAYMAGGSKGSGSRGRALGASSSRGGGSVAYKAGGSSSSGGVAIGGSGVNNSTNTKKDLYSVDKDYYSANIAVDGKQTKKNRYSVDKDFYTADKDYYSRNKPKYPEKTDVNTGSSSKVASTNTQDTSYPSSGRSSNRNKLSAVDIQKELIDKCSRLGSRSSKCKDLQVPIPFYNLLDKNCMPRSPCGNNRQTANAIVATAGHGICDRNDFVCISMKYAYQQMRETADVKCKKDATCFWNSRTRAKYFTEEYQRHTKEMYAFNIVQVRKLREEQEQKWKDWERSGRQGPPPLRVTVNNAGRTGMVDSQGNPIEYDKYGNRIIKKTFQVKEVEVAPETKKNDRKEKLKKQKQRREQIAQDARNTIAGLENKAKEKRVEKKARQERIERDIAEAESKETKAEKEARLRKEFAEAGKLCRGCEIELIDGHYVVRQVVVQEKRKTKKIQQTQPDGLDTYVQNDSVDDTEQEGTFIEELISGAIDAAVDALTVADYLSTAATAGAVVLSGPGAVITAPVATTISAAKKAIVKKGKSLLLKLKPCSPKCCFAAGTPVLTKYGLKPIESIKKGDLIASKNEKTLEIGWKPVTRVLTYNDRATYRLVLVDEKNRKESYEVSDNHPFWVDGVGWIDSIDLKHGMKIPSYNGGFLTVSKILALNRSPTTYNFEVEGFNTYFVGEQGAWVHNIICCTKATKGVARIPGRVQSSINVSNKGFDHVMGTHLNSAKAVNKSQFTIGGAEVRALLNSKTTVQAQVRALETGNFARTVTTDRVVGNLANKMGGSSTKTFTVITDKFGNLQSMFPGGL